MSDIIRNFDDLIHILDTKINWDEFSPEHSERVESALSQIYANPQILSDRIEKICADPELLKSYLPHIEYPRALMDKFMLYMDPQDRFRVRLHRLKSKMENKGARPESPHDHRWNYTTLLMSGEYMQTTYEEFDVNEERGTASLRKTGEQHLHAGAVSSAYGHVIHNVANPSEDVSCVTLFLRGRSLRDHNTVYNQQTGKFARHFGQAKEIRKQFKLLNDLIMNK